MVEETFEARAGRGGGGYSTAQHSTVKYSTVQYDRSIRNTQYLVTAIRNRD